MTIRTTIEPSTDAVARLTDECLADLHRSPWGPAGLEAHMSDWMRDHRVVFAGGTIPFLPTPHFLSAAVVDRIAHSVEVLTRVLDRFCRAWLDDDVLRRRLDLPPAESELIGITPSLLDPLQICRLDAFLMPDGSVRFLEFNAESPAGIGYTDVMYDGLQAHLPALKRLGGRAHYERITDHLMRSVVDVERRWRSWAVESGIAGIELEPAQPQVMLVDVDGSPSVPEFEIICEALSMAGIRAGWCGLSDLSIVDGRLHAHGAAIDLVVRRALVEDLLDPSASPGAAALIAAVRTGSVAMLNPFTARVANNKKLLALLGDPMHASLLTSDEERLIVNATIPWTRILESGATELPDGSDGDLQQYVISNRMGLVLKPASDYGGRNVHLGRSTPSWQWDALTRAHAGTGDWIVQEYLDVPRAGFPVFDGGRVRRAERYYNINPFAIGGNYAGMITRISDNAVINVSAGGGLLPCVAVRDKGLPDT